MKLHPKLIIMLGSFFLFLAVAIGAFGAHGLEGKITAKGLLTYKTGVQYHFYHGLGLVLVGIVQNLYTTINFEKVALSFTLGILLFSFNCYVYAITSIKTFAMIVPVGGVFFLIGWALMSINLYRSLK